MSLAIGDRVGPYRLIGKHPGGGFRAIAERSRVWIEVGDAADWQASQLAFLDLDTLDHPGIARIVDRGVVDHHPWIATELADGVPLSEIMGRRTLAVDETVAVIRDVASILAQLHECGLVHDAIKPHAIVMQTGVQRTFPIQLGGWLSLRTGDGSEDVHALGVLAYRALTGRFPGLHVPELVPGVPGAVSALIVSMLAADPEERPDAETVLTEIANMGGDRSLAGPRFARPRWTPQPAELQAVAEAITLPRKRV